MNVNIVRKGEFSCYKQFSFAYHVFHSYVSLVRQNVALCGNGLVAIIPLKQLLADQKDFLNFFIG